jgi:hypothetical protein
MATKRKKPTTRATRTPQELQDIANQRRSRETLRRIKDIERLQKQIRRAYSKGRSSTIELARALASDHGYTLVESKLVAESTE